MALVGVFAGGVEAVGKIVHQPDLTVLIQMPVAQAETQRTPAQERGKVQSQIVGVLSGLAQNAVNDPGVDPSRKTAQRQTVPQIKSVLLGAVVAGDAVNHMGVLNIGVSRDVQPAGSGLVRLAASE